MDYALIINGTARKTADYADVKNPSTFEVVGRMPLGTAQDLDDAVAAAAEAFKTWSVTPDAERQAACHAIAAKIEAHAEELAQLITAEQGKQLNGLGSRFEVGGTAFWTHSTADLQLPVEVIQDNEQGRIELHRKAIGVIGSITPWNWPMLIGSWHLIPAVRTGNTIVIKPSPYTPLSTIRMVELMNEVLPPGVVTCVSGDDSLGAAMSTHPGIAKMVFTGSTVTGRKIMASAAPTLKRLTLELGGNDAGVVLPDADPKAIAPGLFWGAFINGGQTCAALKRLYVHDSIYDAVCDALVEFAATVPMGDGRDESNQLGPIQNEMQFKRVCALVDEAKQAGGRILCGGAPRGGNGYFYPITFVADVQEGTRLVDAQAGQRCHRDALDHRAQQPHRHHHRQHRQPDRPARDQRGHGQERGEHQEVALPEVQRPGGQVGDQQALGHQRVDAAHRDARDQHLQEVAQAHRTTACGPAWVWRARLIGGCAFT